MATRDNLTGAASRQVFGSIFWHAVKVCDRRNSAISLIAIDIDNFKEINDTYGHQKGDDVIRTTADIIKGQVRGSDVLCRWGGEEFLLLMEDCDLKCATTVAEKIRRAVRNYDFTFADERRVLTISLGVAERRKDEAKDALVGRADQALYRSKRQGRDRVSQG